MNRLSTMVSIGIVSFFMIILLCIVSFNVYNQKPIYYNVSMANQLQYSSQFHPVDIPGGCEVASLKMALSIKGKAKNVPLYKMTNKIGWYNHKQGNPNIKYSNNPYYAGNEATMYPKLIAKWARYYGTNPKIIDYASPTTIKNTLINRDPIIIEAGHNMQHHWYDDHILCLIGYHSTKHRDYIQYTDSLYNTRHINWCSFKQFWQAYDRPKITGKRAIAVE